MSKNCSFCHKELRYGGMVIHQECLALLGEAHSRNMQLMAENYLLRQLTAVQSRELKRLMKALNENLAIAS